MGTRSRTSSEALLTMWRQGTLRPCVLLARVLSWSRKKLPFEASKVGPPAHGRARVELPEHLLAWQVQSRKDKEDSIPSHPVFPGNERGDEPSKAYRQDLPQRGDATYLNLGTTSDSPFKGVGQLAATAGRGAEPP